MIAEINFISLKPGSDETRVMDTRSDNEEFMNGDDTDEVIKSLFKSCLQRFEENLQEKMRGSVFCYSFCNNDLNKFVLLLRKGVYPYEYMDSWEKFNETHYQAKKIFIVI